MRELREDIQKLINVYKEMQKTNEMLEEKVKIQQEFLEYYKDLFRFILDSKR